MQRLVRFGQGLTEIKEIPKPEERCAQYLTEDRGYVHCEFADMDATAYPALMFVQNIGQMALCTNKSCAGDARRRDDEEGCATPSVFAGRRVIIAQIPACNPATGYNANIEGVYKTLCLGSYF